MLRNKNHILFIVSLALFLSACGSTSSIKPPVSDTDNHVQANEEVNLDQLRIRLSEYDIVLIKNFTDGTPKQNLPEYVGRNFADLIASKLKESGHFDYILRNNEELADKNPDTTTLIVSGEITRYTTGNGALRFLVGFGAGSSYFDSVVKFEDHNNNSIIGEMIVDRNSWALGGGIAASQTVEVFMNEAAEKIAKEVTNSPDSPANEDKDA